MRPRLLIEVGLFEGAGFEALVDAAAAVELLHNYSLIHDDIEDEDPVRHGRATLWTRYGLAQAVNAGDALCALSYLSLLASARWQAPERVIEMARALHTANLAMCRGQSEDLAFEDRRDVTTEQYLEMIAAKTGALFAVSAELGAVCAGAENRAAFYAQLGHHFGIAFQILDDCRGIWADSQSTGKKRGADIVRKKKSFPIVWASEHGGGALRSRLASAYDGGNLEARGLEELAEALRAAGAQEAAYRTLAEHLAFVEQAPAGGVRDFLLALLPLKGSGEIVA